VTRRVILLGGGGHARVVLDAVRAAGTEVAGFVDRDPSARLAELPHLGDDDALLAMPAEDVLLVNGLGSVTSTAARSALHERFTAAGFQFAAVVHPAATIADDAEIESGAQVMAGAVVQTGARIGANALVNTCASVDHDSVVGAHSHVAPGAVICGGVSIGPEVHVGAGAVVVQGVTVGANALIMAGAVVTRDVPERARMAGVPARERTE
jgi:sugar O-acyltransferase (sialic acid O-acetyltransferase NeuD family)